MKTIRIRRDYYDLGRGHDYVSIDDMILFDTSECVDCPQDAYYTRDINNSLRVINFAKTLFEGAGLNFEDYYEVVDEVSR